MRTCPWLLVVYDQLPPLGWNNQRLNCEEMLQMHRGYKLHPSGSKLNYDPPIIDRTHSCSFPKDTVRAVMVNDISADSLLGILIELRRRIVGLVSLNVSFLKMVAFDPFHLFYQKFQVLFGITLFWLGFLIHNWIPEIHYLRNNFLQLSYHVNTRCGVFPSIYHNQLQWFWHANQLFRTIQWCPSSQWHLFEHIIFLKWGIDFRNAQK